MSMNSSPPLPLPGLSRLTDPWRARLRTAEAMLRLWHARRLVRHRAGDRGNLAGESARARRLVRHRTFAAWRARLGTPLPRDAPPPDAHTHAQAEAWALARHVDRAAWRMGDEWLCLPRAIALAGMLRQRGIGYALSIAARPQAARTGSDDLHAWIDVGPLRVIGDLPGEWAVIHRVQG